MNKQKFSFIKAPWFMWLMLILVYPVGLVLLWSYSTFRRNVKLLITLLFGGLFLFILIPKNGTVDVNTDISASPSIQLTQSPAPTIHLTPSPSIARTTKPTPTPSPTPSPTPKRTASPGMKLVTVRLERAMETGGDNIGSEWSTDVTVGDDELTTEGIELILKPSAKIKINCTATEADTKPDIGKKTLTIAVKDLKPGENSYSIEVPVKENAGRNSGKSAIWTFSFIITMD